MYTIMFPLNSKQQKSSRLMSKINPELNEIKKKYQGKKDNDSMAKMNAETQALYAKYGISPMGGCLPLLITLPIMFALYQVINPNNVHKYVPELAKFESAKMFLGLNVGITPIENFKAIGGVLGALAFLVPILAVVFQFLNTRLMQNNTNTNSGSEQDSMAQSMKMMNNFMPLMSGFFCLSLSTGIGIYWIIGSIFRCVQAVIINKQVDSIDMDELIEKNKEKAAAKNKKREEAVKQMEMYSKKKTSSISSVSSYSNPSNDDKGNSDVKVKKEYKKGSISGYANMISNDKK